MFLSRMHLITWVNETHQALAAVWLARRRARRDRAASAAKARIARFFAWCRTSSRGGGGGSRRGAAGAGTAPDSDAIDGGMDEDAGDGGDEPEEVQELMEELAAGSGLPAPPGSDSLVISISPSGFGKSVEYVALGAAALACGAAEGVAAAVDSAALAAPGVKRMLGLCPEFEVQAARLGEVAAAGRAWNAVAAPHVEEAMWARRAALEREVRCCCCCCCLRRPCEAPHLSAGDCCVRSALWGSRFPGLPADVELSLQSRCPHAPERLASLQPRLQSTTAHVHVHPQA